MAISLNVLLCFDIVPSTKKKKEKKWEEKRSSIESFETII